MWCVGSEALTVSLEIDYTRYQPISTNRLTFIFKLGQGRGWGPGGGGGNRIPLPLGGGGGGHLNSLKIEDKTLHAYGQMINASVHRINMVPILSKILDLPLTFI